MAYWQRGWKRQPGGTCTGLGTSPSRIMRLRCASMAGSGTGTAEINAWVVGMQRRVEQIVPIGQLDDDAQVHHCDPIADVAHHRQVVRNEQIGQASFDCRSSSKLTICA